MADHRDELDEQTARLQRVAYGADASDDERAAALGALASLAGGTAGPAARAPGGGPVPAPGASAGATAGATPSGDAAPTTAGPGAWERRRAVRLAVASAATALLVGGAAGWALGIAAGPSTAAGDDTPVERTQAWQVFDRRAGDGDLVRHPPPEEDVELDDSSRRLLLTRSDGVRLVAARTADRTDACLILVLPVGRPGIACTESGRFPADGLRAEVSARAIGEYLAVWHADGRVTVNAAAVPSG
ncbi:MULTISPECIES: hypothetical protein [unclassified Agromyces]|uniref:hypothetical protein n=1 Tax=unclassified Agromyces TaxID=2639701 RepID=UPI0030155950